MCQRNPIEDERKETIAWLVRSFFANMVIIVPLGLLLGFLWALYNVLTS